MISKPKWLTLSNLIRSDIRDEISMDERNLQVRRYMERIMAQSRQPITPLPGPDEIDHGYVWGRESMRAKDRHIPYVAAQIASGRGEISISKEGKIIFHLSITREDQSHDLNLIPVDEIWLVFNPPPFLTDPDWQNWPEVMM